MLDSDYLGIIDEIDVVCYDSIEGKVYIYMYIVGCWVLGVG